MELSSSDLAEHDEEQDLQSCLLEGTGMNGMPALRNASRWKFSKLAPIPDSDDPM